MSFDDILDTARHNLPWWKDLTPTERAWADLYLRAVCHQVLDRRK